jgi:hypothetical protein
MKQIFKLYFLILLLGFSFDLSSQTYTISPSYSSGTITVALISSPNSSGTISNIEFSLSLPSGGTITVNSNPYGFSLNGAGTLWTTATGSGSTVINFNPSTTILTFNYSGPAGSVTVSSTYVEIGGVERTSSGGSTNIVLPVTLKTFTATKLEGSNALLNWTTSSEVDASHFEIERSFDLENWTKLATQEARGQNGVDTDYSYLDQNIIAERNGKGVVYYRLQMVDIDKSRKTSDIRSITLDPLKEIYYQAFPNPASDKINVQLQVPATKEDMTDLLLIDNAGKIQSKTSISTNGITTFDVRDLPKGVYHMQIKSGAEVLTKKVILIDN